MASAEKARGRSCEERERDPRAAGRVRLSPERMARELARIEILFAPDKALKEKGYGLIAGLDEAGRGPWAGPVVAAAVILADPAEPRDLIGVNDSKRLTPIARQRLYPLIRQQALAWGIGVVSARVIDEINILQATRRAMAQALNRLRIRPDCLLVDGSTPLDTRIEQFLLKGGDGLSVSIAAASILAKVTRDRMMVALDKKFPQYRFAENKGYGTPVHLAALKRHGPCPYHRQTFKPVKLLGEGSVRADS